MSARLDRYAWLSIAAALVTMGIKLLAWRMTGSVGLLSDALESSVNLAAAALLVVALRVAAQPPDDEHQFGHDKAELFSAGAEGLMIVVAAGLILWQAVDRLLEPRDLDQVGAGAAVSAAAAAVNLAVGMRLTRAGREHHSLALVADGKHLLTDVWTSAGVVAGIALVAVTGLRWLDPVLAIAVGLNIVLTGGRLVWRSMHSLMDPAMPAAEREVVDAILGRYAARGVRFHALRSRVAGQRRFLTLHVLVPGAWTVRDGHDLVEVLERELQGAIPHLTVLSHLEPVEDPGSYGDDQLR